MSDPYRHVRTGDPLHIPARTYNAFADTARAHAMQQTNRRGGGFTSPLVYDVLIRNDTGEDLDRFAVVGIGDPLTTPEDREEGFVNNLAYAGEAPAAAFLGRFGVLQEPIRVDAIGRAVVSGLAICRVHFPEDGLTYADLNLDAEPTAPLKAQGFGPAQIVWEEGGEEPDRWAVVRLGNDSRGEAFAVLVTIDGGSAGTDEEDCSWTYTVTDLAGVELGTELEPTTHRKPLIPYVETPAESVGWATYNRDGDLVLLWANEQEAVDSCEEAEDLANPEGWTRIVASADESVTNAGQTDHTEFEFEVEAGGFYMIELLLLTECSDPDADTAISFSVDDGTMQGYFKAECIAINLAGNGTALAGANPAAASTGNVTAGGAGADFPIPIKGLGGYKVSDDTTLHLRFGNSIPTSGATTKVYQGSVLRYKRVK